VYNTSYITLATRKRRDNGWIEDAYTKRVPFSWSKPTTNTGSSFPDLIDDIPGGLFDVRLDYVPIPSKLMITDDS